MPRFYQERSESAPLDKYLATEYKKRFPTRTKKLQKAVPFGAANVDRFSNDESSLSSPCARACYDPSETTPETQAASIAARMKLMQAAGHQSSCFASRQTRFKRQAPELEGELKQRPGFVESIMQGGRVVYTMRSRRRRFEWEKPAPKAIVSEIPDVILKTREKTPPGENPFHRTIQGNLNGHANEETPMAGRLVFESKSPAHPIAGVGLRQTLFANAKTTPATLFGAGILGPGQYELDEAMDSQVKKISLNSMFKTRGCAGMKEPEEDWRTSPNIAEDWTKRRTQWSHESGRYIVHPFVDKIQRFKPIEPTVGPGTYKCPADNITNLNSPKVRSSFQSLSPQIVPFMVDPLKPEALEYDPKWESANRQLPFSGGPHHCFISTTK